MKFLKDAFALPIAMFTEWFPQMRDVCMGIFDEIPTLFRIIGLLIALVWAVPKFIWWFINRD